MLKYNATVKNKYVILIKKWKNPKKIIERKVMEKDTRFIEIYAIYFSICIYMSLYSK